MDYIKILRKIFILLIVLILLAVLLLVFQFTDVAFRVWDRLQSMPKGFLFIYFIGIIVIACAGLFLIYKIWALGKLKSKKENEAAKISIESVQEKLANAEKQGFDVAGFKETLATANKEASSQLEIAFFGQISTGKSALIQTMLPKAHLEISSIGGSTAHLDRYYYELDTGLELALLDTPGINQILSDKALEKEVSVAVRKVHIVCYVLDKDISATDYQAIEQLLAFNKPLVLILNKTNQYQTAEKAALIDHFKSVLPGTIPIVSVASDYYQIVQKVKSSGEVTRQKKMKQGDIHSLLEVIADMSLQKGDLQEKQKQAIIHLTDDMLDESLAKFRLEKGRTLVGGYSRKAMLGGVAAVGPGTDILVQGYLGMDMLKALCKLYDVSAQDIDLQSLVEAATGKLKTQMTVILALAGNICKAFPGIGTVIGGASHAVAYGLIFESLGNAVVTTLDQGDTKISTETILDNFEEELHHDMEKKAIGLVKTLIGRKKTD